MRMESFGHKVDLKLRSLCLNDKGLLILLVFFSQRQGSPTITYCFEMFIVKCEAISKFFEAGLEAGC